MPDAMTLVPPRRAALVIGPPAENGARVIKDQQNGSYYRLGEQEAFLLSMLDGQHTREAVCSAYAARFGESLSADDLGAFVDQARECGLVGSPETPPQEAPAPAPPPSPQPASAPAAAAPHPRQSVLHWRMRLFDPDRFLTWLNPRLDYVFTRGFVLLSLAGILAAALVAWSNRADLLDAFADALNWKTLALMWITLLAVTFCHEFAHGLTCKHYGGEVHEVGFLLLFLMPSLYCNVSDAWLFPEKRKRLLVTLAGGYCDLIVWAIAVFCWRLWAIGTFAHHLAWVLITLVGARILLNLNPLIRLDGYYILSDLVDVPNMRERSTHYLMSRLRWLLWGAAQPAPQGKGRFLLLYGLASWIFGLGFLTAMVTALMQFAADRWGLGGAAAVFLLAGVLLRGMLQGLCDGEVAQMVGGRPWRRAAWGVAAVSAVAFLAVGRLEDRAGGNFQLRPVVRAEVRSPLTAFVHEVFVEEGTSVRPGMLLARLSIPNLDTQLAQARAEVREAQARLRLLLAGTKPEELQAQRDRVGRAKLLRELAQRNLQRATRAYNEELRQLERQTDQVRAEADCALDSWDRARRLHAIGALAEESYREAIRRGLTAEAHLGQVQAQQRSRRALGCREAELELARRDQELGEARSELAVLEASARPEEVEAEKARLARAREQVRYLEDMAGRLEIHSPLAGIVTTPRLTDRVGQYIHEGEIVCLVEKPGALEAEVELSDQDAAGVKPGQPVSFRPRDLPRQTMHGQVERVAPRTVRSEAPARDAHVTVYCSLEDTEATLRPGAIGYARIIRGRTSAHQLLTDWILRQLRAEFWW